MPIDDQITVLIPTSPIPSHPSTAIIDQTIASVRFWLPKSEIFVMCDGIRPEQEDRRVDYADYVWKLYRSKDIRVIVYLEFLHQAMMMKRTLCRVRVKTPLILYVEHDTPLVTDEPIEWQHCMQAIYGEEYNSVRFMHESHILPEHEYLMCGRAEGWPLIKTIQYSARPHLASTDWYRRLIAGNFTEDSRTFLEDKLHSVVQCAPWERYRLAIYAPPGNMKRSLHLDGRSVDPKYEMKF